MYTNKEIWNVSYPIFLGLLAQNIINVTDTAFLGRVGEVELGASAMGDRKSADIIKSSHSGSPQLDFTNPT